MLEAAPLEVDILSIAQLHGSICTPQPSLIVQLVVVGTVNLRTQLVSLSQIHASLQGNMPFFAGTHPGGMAEGDALDGDVADRMFWRSEYIEERCDDRISGTKSSASMAFRIAWHVV